MPNCDLAQILPLRQTIVTQPRKPTQERKHMSKQWYEMSDAEMAELADLAYRRPQWLTCEDDYKRYSLLDTIPDAEMP
jgi:hypothetical protein